MWSPVFFRLQDPSTAFLVICALTVLVPYVACLVFALSLNAAIVNLNRGELYQRAFTRTNGKMSMFGGLVPEAHSSNDIAWDGDPGSPCEFIRLDVAHSHARAYLK